MAKLRQNRLDGFRSLLGERKLRALGFCAVAGAAGFFAPAAAIAAPEAPGFVYQSLYADNRGAVFGVYEARHADFVLIAGGFDSGFRRGMVCQVSAGQAEVAEIILVDVRENSSAALILDLQSESMIEPGQSVRIKTVNL